VATYNYAGTSYNATLNCGAMLTQIKKSPMTVVLDATDLKGYKSGVLNSNRTSINHAVLLVGVDSCNNWIIQNSWGAGWGQAGFATLAAGNTANICYYGGLYTTMA